VDEGAPHSVHRLQRLPTFDALVAKIGARALASRSLLNAATGSPIWSKVFGGLPLDTRGAAILSDGSIVDIGFFVGSATFGSVVVAAPSGAMASSSFFARFDAQGNTLAASVGSDVFPSSNGAGQADTDPQGNLVVVVNYITGGTVSESADTYDTTMHRLRSVPLAETASTSSSEMTSNGSVFALYGDAVSGFVDADELAPDGTPLWSFHPPMPALGGTAAGDGPSRSFVWADSLWSVDAAGAASELTPNHSLDKAVSEALGHTAWVIQSPTLLVVDGQHDIFVCGFIVATAKGGGAFHPFVAKLQP
jgi:hypothetical protein